MEKNMGFVFDRSYQARYDLMMQESKGGVDDRVQLWENRNKTCRVDFESRNSVKKEAEEDFLVKSGRKMMEFLCPHQTFQFPFADIVGLNWPKVEKVGVVVAVL